VPTPRSTVPSTFKKTVTRSVLLACCRASLVCHADLRNGADLFTGSAVGTDPTGSTSLPQWWLQHGFWPCRLTARSLLLTSIGMARHEHGSISSFAEHCWVRRRSSLLPSRRSSHAHGATNLSWKYFRLLRYATPQRYVASLSLDHAHHVHSLGKRLITGVRMAFEYLSNVQVLCAGSAPGSRPARVFKDLYQHGVGTLQASCSQADKPLCSPLCYSGRIGVSLPLCARAMAGDFRLTTAPGMFYMRPLHVVDNFNRLPTLGSRLHTSHAFASRPPWKSPTTVLVPVR